MSDCVSLLVEKGKKLTDGINKVRIMIRDKKIEEITAKKSVSDIANAMILCFENCESSQFDAATQMVLEFTACCSESFLYFNNERLFAFLERVETLSLTSIVNFVFLLNNLIIAEPSAASKIGFIFLNKIIPIVPPQIQSLALNIIKEQVLADKSLAPKYANVVYGLLTSMDLNLRQYSYKVIALIFEAMNIQEIPLPAFISVLNNIPGISDRQTILKLLLCVERGMQYKEFFYGIFNTMFTFYAIPSLENVANDEDIISHSMQICINFFPKQKEFPPEFTRRSSNFGINNDKYMSSAAPFVLGTFLRHPQNSFVASAMMLIFKSSRLNLDDAFFEALRKCGTVTDNIPCVLFMCSMINDQRIMKYRINNQIINCTKFKSNQWYAKLLKTVSKKYPKDKSENSILEYGSLDEILELFDTTDIPIDNLVDKKVFGRLIDLIKEHGRLDDININSAIDNAMKIIDTLTFSHEQSPWSPWNSYAIREFLSHSIRCNISKGKRSMYVDSSLTKPMSFIEGKYNLAVNPDIANCLLVAIVDNQELQNIIVPELENISLEGLQVPERLAVLCRIFNVKEYQRFSFKINNLIFTIDDSLSTVVASQINSINDIFNMKLNIELIPEVNDRVSLKIPKVELEEKYSDAVNFLKTVHELCPNISMKSSDFTRRVISGINSPLEAVLRKSAEIQFVYSYPFLFTFEEKLFVANTVLATPLETVEVFAERLGIKFNSPAIRHKCKVKRNDVYSFGSVALKLAARSSLDIGFLFEGEAGFGRGPTQEFFTLMSRELKRSERKMWRTDSEGEFAFSKEGLFPRADANPEDFYILGILASKALQETKFLEIELSTPFVKLINGQSITVSEVDSNLGNYLKDPKSLAAAGVDFTYPGIPTLGRANEEVTEENVNEYIEFIKENTIGKPILKCVEQFKAGFLRNAEISAISIFESSEFARALCGDKPMFNKSDLERYIVPEHGFTKRSRGIKDLIQCIVEFTPEQQKSFCKFVTGAERLPPGGIKELRPPLTVALVKDSDDGNLPTVSTCANYLKLPQYSSKEALKEKLLFALDEGNTFELS